MKQILTLILCAATLLIAACGGDPRADIDAQEAVLKKLMDDDSQSSPDAIREGFGKLIDAYEAYMAEGNSLSAEEYFKVAELYESTGNYTQTIAMLEKLRTEHPKTDRAADALFKIGFIQHNNLNDLQKAEDTYRKFINTYPDHHFADDAQMEIDNLGVSPEEIIRRAQEKAAADTAQVPQ
ncbi:MAG: tetratricopeptide repeat protein [Bacteroidia bacterium]